jgi:hypothetical protein
MEIRPARSSDAVGLVGLSACPQLAREEAPEFYEALGYEGVRERSARFMRSLAATPPAGAP